MKIKLQVKKDYLKWLNWLIILPDSQKRILNMRIFQEYSFKEIANIEEVSINTALGRMRYALINLRKLIKENGIQMEV